MKLGALLPMPCQPLHAIFLKIIISIRLSNVMVHVNKALNSVLPSGWSHWFSHEVIEGVIQILSMLVLIDHVVIQAVMMYQKFGRGSPDVDCPAIERLTHGSHQAWAHVSATERQ